MHNFFTNRTIRLCNALQHNITLANNFMQFRRLLLNADISNFIQGRV